MDSKSACLDGFKSIEMPVKHAMLNKYRGIDDMNYQQVLDTTHKFANLAEQTLRNRQIWRELPIYGPADANDILEAAWNNVASDRSHRTIL